MCKIFGPKIRSWNFIDKSQVWITILMEERGYDRRITEWIGRLIRLEVRVNGEEEKQGSLNLTTFFLLIIVWCLLTWSKTKPLICIRIQWFQDKTRYILYIFHICIYILIWDITFLMLFPVKLVCNWAVFALKHLCLRRSIVGAARTAFATHLLLLWNARCCSRVGSFGIGAHFGRQKVTRRKNGWKAKRNLNG